MKIVMKTVGTWTTHLSGNPNDTRPMRVVVDGDSLRFYSTNNGVEAAWGVVPVASIKATKHGWTSSSITVTDKMKFKLDVDWVFKSKCEAELTTEISGSKRDGDPIEKFERIGKEVIIARCP